MNFQEFLGELTNFHPEVKQQLDNEQQERQDPSEDHVSFQVLISA
jgi:hypothetical protein